MLFLGREGVKLMALTDLVNLHLDRFRPVARSALVLLRRAADSGSLKLAATQGKCQLSRGFRLLHPSTRT